MLPRAQVLNKRRGRTLTKRTILKSYQHPTLEPVLPGVPDLRQSDGLPVYSVGDIPLSGLRRLLDHLGAGPSGGSHVAITDVREVRGGAHISVEGAWFGCWMWPETVSLGHGHGQAGGE